MKIMSVNSGSSSLKFQLLDMPEEKIIVSGLIEKIGNSNAIFKIKFTNTEQKMTMPIVDHQKAVELLIDILIKNKIIKDFQEIEGIGHRIVQGGEIFKDAIILTEENILKIESLNSLAPLHNPANVVSIKAFKKVAPHVLQVGVFDTTFHQTIPQENFLYAVPYEWYKEKHIRKFGFHGISYKYTSDRAVQLLNKKDSKMIICHVGNGASLCAIKNNKSVDTSMGFTPLEGVPMGTRSGNIDPTIIQFLLNQGYKDIDGIMNDLNKKSGYLGVSGISNDARDIEKGYKEGHERSILAYNIQIQKILYYIGSYYFLLKGLDALVFTAGIG